MLRITIISTALLAAASVAAQEAPSPAHANAQQAAGTQQIANVDQAASNSRVSRAASNEGTATARKPNESKSKGTQANDAKASNAKADGSKPNDAKTLSGISILGNQEAPKSLVIVPWKGSEIGDMPGLSRLLDDGIQPVDKDVFMRELSYYEIRQGKQ